MKNFFDKQNHWSSLCDSEEKITEINLLINKFKLILNNVEKNNNVDKNEIINLLNKFCKQVDKINFHTKNSITVHLNNVSFSRIKIVADGRYQSLAFSSISFIDADNKKIGINQIRCVSASSCAEINYYDNKKPEDIITNNSASPGFETHPYKKGELCIEFINEKKISFIEIELRRDRIESFAGDFSVYGATENNDYKKIFHPIDSVKIPLDLINVLGGVFDSDEKIYWRSRLAAVVCNVFYLEELRESAKSEKEKNNFIDGVKDGLPENYGITQHGITKLLSAYNPRDLVNGICEFSEIFLEVIKRPIFITSGTLLGFVRDNEFMGHDDDIDLCYFSGAIDELNIIQERGLIFSILNRIDGVSLIESTGGHFQVFYRLRDGSKTIAFDLFTAFTTDENNYFQYPLTTTDLVLSDVLPLGKFVFMGCNFFVPKNYKKHLAKNYGENWMYKDKLFRFDWNSVPNLYEFLTKNKIYQNEKLATGIDVNFVNKNIAIDSKSIDADVGDMATKFKFEAAAIGVKFIEDAGSWFLFGIGNGDLLSYIESIKLSSCTEIVATDDFKGLDSEWGSKFKKFDFSVPEKKQPKIEKFSSRIVIKNRNELKNDLIEPKDKKFSFVYLDTTTYSSTKLVLNLIKKYLFPGTVIVFDEYIFNDNGCILPDEHNAFTEFCAENGLFFKYLAKNSWSQVCIKLL